MFEAGRAAGAMAERDALAQLIAQALRDLGAEHRLKEPVQIAAKRLSLGKREWLSIAVAEMLKVRRCGAKHREAAVRVAQ